jgi:hypothetical protein
MRSRLLDVAKGTPASRAAAMKACLSVWGPIGLFIPARRATRRMIRPAPWRSLRCPLAPTKMGPARRSRFVRSLSSGFRGRLCAPDDATKAFGASRSCHARYGTFGCLRQRRSDRAAIRRRCGIGYGSLP